MPCSSLIANQDEVEASSIDELTSVFEGFGGHILQVLECLYRPIDGANIGHPYQILLSPPRTFTPHSSQIRAPLKLVTHGDNTDFVLACLEIGAIHKGGVVIQDDASLTYIEVPLQIGVLIARPPGRRMRKPTRNLV
ncbi:hypothetical protein ASD37_19590 [Mycobacterium sp. Root135]|nr:hypothetical protein ASD37_19590 [Mycobacterium sp. Root135]